MSEYLVVHRIELVSLVACLGLIGIVFELVRRRQIKEKYSLLWFLMGASLVALTLNRPTLDKVASTLGIYYAPSALFLVLTFFIITILIHYSIVLSKLLTQNQKLAQKLALLENELRVLDKKGIREN